MSNYYPLNYRQINCIDGHYSPSMVKSYNNQVFGFWERALFQRCLSIVNAENLPEEWKGKVKDFLYYCIFRFGYVAVFEHSDFGLTFNPCTLKGFDWFYQPTNVLVANPALKKTLDLEIGKDCELLKLTPDYMGIYDVVTYYAEKLATLDNALNMSIINNKFAFILGARNKGMAEALKKILDKVNKGEPAVIYDQRILNDTQDKDVPYQFLERSNLKTSYITSDQLMDFQTLLNNFDAEIGIPTVPYQKKERMVTSEADSRIIDSTSRSVIWLESLNESCELINNMFGTSMNFSLRYELEKEDDNGEDNINRTE